jgi:hypothetical protein
MGSGLPSSINLIRTIGIVLTALSLHGLGTTEAAAQLRGAGVPSVSAARSAESGLRSAGHRPEWVPRSAGCRPE